jgi:hypothetical protein
MVLFHHLVVQNFNLNWPVNFPLLFECKRRNDEERQREERMQKCEVPETRVDQT